MLAIRLKRISNVRIGTIFKLTNESINCSEIPQQIDAKMDK